MKFLRALALLGLGWSLVGAVVSCQDRDVLPNSSVQSAAPDEGLAVAASCVPGQTIECRGGCGAPSSGFQVCATDGRSYGPCVCPPLRILPIPAIPNRTDGDRRVFPRSPLFGGLPAGAGGSSGFGGGGGPIAGNPGSNSGAGSGLVGATCRSAADCIEGLGCLTAAGGELNGGGPQGGYCTMPCGTDAACAAVDRASQCIGFAGQNLCARNCASRAPSPGESKCLGREDVVCVSLVAQGEEPSGTGPQPGLCVPSCQSDAQCGRGLFCDLASGLCTSQRPPGAAIGSRCVVAEDCASGLCLPLNDDVESFCSAFCRLGVPGCGFDGSEAEVGATCLLPLVRDEGAGDRGLCLASCDVDSDCSEAGAVCVPAPAEGRAGVCLVPAEVPPLPPGTTPDIGNACVQSADCGGGGLTCITPTSDFIGIPGSPAGGYCTSGCAADGSCPEPGTLCVTRGELRQCLRACDPTTADDCGGRDTLACQAFAQGDPTRGFCRPQCSADTQCGERSCDLASGLCVEAPEPACTVDADCEPGEVCLTAFGTCLALPLECLDDDDCAQGECDTATNTCVASTPECASNADCPDGVCDTARGECVAAPPSCTSDEDCGAQVCDLPEGVCVAPPEGCTSDADCGAQSCDLSLGVCVPPAPECVSDADCGAEVCDEPRGVCVPASPECASNADCGLEVCNVATGVCVPAPECTTDAQCAGRSCDPNLGVCVDEPSCTLDVDCPGQVCDPSAALCIAAPAVPAGGACLQDGECAGELCASVDGETSFCTAFCLLGTPIGCEPYGTDNFCLLPIDPNDDQFGICVELCNTAADCAQPGYECLSIGGAINGRTGGCLPPLPPPPPAAPPPAAPAP